ncbi:MAG: DUF3052 domain-containing protein [Chloroflexi bacterium]|nr:DUF3052 domain-containing protein [Chloroflexota bacterium]
MPTKPLADRMHLRAGERLLLVGAPDGYAAILDAPDSVEIASTPQGTFDVIQVFVTTRAALEAEASRLKALLSPDGKLWFTYPKGTSTRLSADINRDDIRRYALTVGLQTVAQVAVDDDWSAIRCKVVA